MNKVRQNTGPALVQAIIKWLMIPLGTTFVVLGGVTFLLPLPIGLPLLLFGSLILIRYSVVARSAVAGASRRYPGFRRVVRCLRALQRRTVRRVAGFSSRRRQARPNTD